MDSIGNDIVALGAVNVARTITPNFYNKILAGSELPLHQSNCPGIPFYQFVWLAWSVKEAAYKCLKRIQPDLVFSPARTIITSIIAPLKSIYPVRSSLHQTGIDDAGCYHIKVSVNATMLHARSIIYGTDLIHSMALLQPDFSNVQWGIEQIAENDPESQSAAVRKFLLERSDAHHPHQQMIITKDVAGIPSINNSDGKLPVSFAHHGKWVGYAY